MGKTAERAALAAGLEHSVSGSYVQDVGLNLRIVIFANDVTITLLMDKESAAKLAEKIGQRMKYPAQPKAREKCGTYAGVQEHKRAGESCCRTCLRANARYMAAYRRRGKCARGLGWPL